MATNRLTVADRLGAMFSRMSDVMEDGVLSSKREQGSGFAVFITLGAICMLLLGLVIWEPKVGAWVSQAVEAESYKPPVESEFAGR